MKKIPFIFLLLFSPTVLFSQHSLIISSYQNNIYMGINNTINFLIENSACKNYTLTATNAEIEPTNSPCIYIAKAGQPGKVKIAIVDNLSKKTIAERDFNALKLPAPVIMLAGKKSGEISKAYLKPQLGLLAVLEGFDIEARFIVEKYTVILLRQGKVYFNYANVGASFMPEVKEAFQKIEAGDKVIFADAMFQGPDKQHGELNPVEFSITD